MSKFGAYVGGFWDGFFTHAGLSSEDGHLSFSKLFGILVLASYFLSPGNLPSGVAITLIIASFGQKTMMAWIDKGSVTASGEDKSQINLTRSKTEAKTETITHNIDERIGWNSERDFQES